MHTCTTCKHTTLVRAFAAVAAAVRKKRRVAAAVRKKRRVAAATKKMRRLTRARRESSCPARPAGKVRGKTRYSLVLSSLPLT